MTFPSPWEPIALILEETFPREAISHEAFSGDSFLEILVPTTEQSGKFFGTNIFNIFIAQKAYGWIQCGDSPNQRQFNWPPEGFLEARDRYLADLDRWPSYKTFIWVDFWTPSLNLMGNDWLSMMDQTDSAIQDFCDTTEGFTYMGRIESMVEAPFFTDAITEHFGTRAYKTGSS